MCRGAEYMYAVTIASLDIAGSFAAPNIGGPAGQHARFRRLRTACAEFNHACSHGGFDYTRSFGGNGRLEPNGRKQISLWYLRLNHGSANSQERFPWE